MTLSGLFNRIRTRALLEFETLQWQSEIAALAGNMPANDQAGTVLLCELMANYASIKVEILLATALRQRGHSVAVLLPSRNTMVERLHRAAGATTFFYLDTLTTADEHDDCQRQAAVIVAEASDLNALFDHEADGFRSGRNALSTAIRRLRVGRLNSGSSEHRTLVGACLAESLLTQIAVTRLLDTAKPTLALFNERGYTPAGEVFDGCLLRGVDCVQWFGAPQSDSLIYKRYTLATRDRHPLALGSDTWTSLQQADFPPAEEDRIMQLLARNYAKGAWFNRQQLQEGKAVFDAVETRRRLGVAERRKVAVVFAHILYDATFFYGSSLFQDYEAWLIETVRCAIANPALDWIIKVHPVNVWRSKMDGAPMEQLESIAIERAVGTLPPHVRILPADTTINTYSLFGAIDYGITVRGTIGMELPCFGIPTVTAGTGRYSGAGFTIDPQTPDEYRAVLARLHETPPLDQAAIRLARLYLWGTFFRRPVRMQSFLLDFNANRYGLSDLTADTTISPAVQTSGHFLDDVENIATWLSSSTASDLLEQDSPA